ncbi:hypothetical protein BJV74DRAFT_842735 [Russula compacta]|nr:hypothetical protein BJV74DRAFT_842735 [Russula compacta]
MWRIPENFPVTYGSKYNNTAPESYKTWELLVTDPSRLPSRCIRGNTVPSRCIPSPAYVYTRLISDALTRGHLGLLIPKVTSETSKGVRSLDDRAVALRDVTRHHRAAQTATKPIVLRKGYYRWPCGIPKPKPSRRRHSPALDYPSRAPCRPNEPSTSTSLKTREVGFADTDTQPRRLPPSPLRRAVSCGSLPFFAPGKSDVQVQKDTFLPLPGIFMTTPLTNGTASSQSRVKHNVDKSSLLSLAALPRFLRFGHVTTLFLPFVPIFFFFFFYQSVLLLQTPHETGLSIRYSGVHVHPLLLGIFFLFSIQLEPYVPLSALVYPDANFSHRRQPVLYTLYYSSLQ